MTRAEKTFRVVLIEDDPNDADLVRRAIREQNIPAELEHYRDGQSALAAMDAGTELPDLFVVDLNLPKTDGISVLKSIRQRPRCVGVPVAILTSSNSSFDRHRVQLIGADRYVQKPIMLEDFIREVGNAVRDMLAGANAR
jgi:two-component system, chemotaxis family, response regulator Rcp1